MKSRQLIFSWSALFVLMLCVSPAMAQLPGTLYTWDAAGTLDWARNFGETNTSATLSNSGGALTIVETSTNVGGGQAITDGFNTIDENTVADFIGGLDLTGLETLEFDLGHNGAGNVGVQFFTQATGASNTVVLANLDVAPGINTYSLPISGLTKDQKSYMRTIGINIFNHAAEGNLTWTLDEVRSAGTPAQMRVTADFNTDLDGASVNFDNAAVNGNDGGQNQTGLSAPSGALRWGDLANQGGGAIMVGNGNNTYPTSAYESLPVDLRNYRYMEVSMMAEPSGGDDIGFQAYMQTGASFAFTTVGVDSLPVDGQYHTYQFVIQGTPDLGRTDVYGIDLFDHSAGKFINIDYFKFIAIPEPTSIALAMLGFVGLLGFSRKRR